MSDGERNGGSGGAFVPSGPELDAATVALAARTLERCDALAAISDRPGVVSRAYLTPEHARANKLVGEWMSSAGMQVHTDGSGNLVGRWPAADSAAPALLIGSHLDTVPDAGRYDGMLGVLLGVAAVELLTERGVTLPFHLDVVGFGDEEGVRFGATLLGSRALAGTWDPAWFELQDRDGVTLREALTRFGLVPDRIASASRAGDPLVGYLEVHIEQGPVLEDRDQPLGVVTAIAGAQRLWLRMEGRAGHAGTVPMTLRQDALAGAARAIALLEDMARADGLTATVGRIHSEPGAPNVIPGRAEFSVDLRTGDDALRRRVLDRYLEDVAALCRERGLTLSSETTHQADAARCAPWLQDALAESIRVLGFEPLRLESGAGHDAMAVARICDVGMLFLRCTGGISHHPDEAVLDDDVAWALAALALTLERISRQPLPSITSEEAHGS